MTDRTTQDWMNQWQALSRQYWNAWQDLSREAGASAGRDPASVPWHEGFEQWARMFGGSGPQSETVERVLASAKTFTQFAQSMIAAATGAQSGAMPNWSDALRKGFGFAGAPGATFGNGMFGNPLASALHDISGQGVKGFEQMMAGLAPMLDPSREMKSWLNVPAFGFLREHQEHYQKMATAMLDYQEQSARYNTLILKASQRGFEIFESKLAAREEPGRHQIDSLRALYDLWVDAAEEAYAEIALSPEFREVYGNLVNAQMRVRSQVQQEVERIATDFGMPTRSELDSIGQRLHDLRREVRNGTHAGNGDVSREIESLRREVAALKTALAAHTAARKPAAATTKAAPRHKRVRPAAKKRAPQVAALKADIKESVRTLAREAEPAEPVAQTKKLRLRRRHPTAPRAKKSMPKVAHTAVKVGEPVTSFAARIAEFARDARRHRKEIRRASRKGR